MTHHVTRSLSHPLTATGRAEPSLLTRERYDALSVTVFALKTKKAEGRNAAFEIRIELLDDVVGQRGTF